MENQENLALDAGTRAPALHSQRSEAREKRVALHSGQVLRRFELRAAAGPDEAYTDYVWRGRNLVSRIDPVFTGSARTGETLWGATLDHLGSPRLFTKPDGLGGVDMDVFHYYPFGQELGADDPAERMRFTGHERDGWGTGITSDDLDYMHARSHHTSLARFLQVDRLRGSIARPQSLNRFAYVMGAPIGKIDAKGLCGSTVWTNDAMTTAHHTDCTGEAGGSVDPNGWVVGNDNPPVTALTKGPGERDQEQEVPFGCEHPVRELLSDFLAPLFDKLPSFSNDVTVAAWPFLGRAGLGGVLDLSSEKNGGVSIWAGVAAILGSSLEIMHGGGTGLTLGGGMAEEGGNWRASAEGGIGLGISLELLASDLTHGVDNWEVGAGIIKGASVSGGYGGLFYLVLPKDERCPDE